MLLDEGESKRSRSKVEGGECDKRERRKGDVHVFSARRKNSTKLSPIPPVRKSLRLSMLSR